jgi:hypothetical protein
MRRSRRKGRRWRASVLVTGVLGGLGAAGCGASTPGTAATAPSWAKYLGRGVSVVAPGSDSAPGTLVTAYVAVLNGSKVSAFCRYVEPSVQSACHKALAGVTSTDGASISHFRLGYAAIDGTRALVGLTGTNCNPDQKPRCDTNTDPAALFSSHQSFGTLYSQALASQNPNTTANTYSLAPCVQVDSKWYIDVPAKDI